MQHKPQLDDDDKVSLFSYLRESNSRPKTSKYKSSKTPVGLSNCTTLCNEIEIDERSRYR